MKTANLMPPAIDWAVAKCEQFAPVWNDVMEDFFLPSSMYCYAAMRCYVASQLGDDIEIPEELK